MRVQMLFFFHIFETQLMEFDPTWLPVSRPVNSVNLFQKTSGTGWSFSQDQVLSKELLQAIYLSPKRWPQSSNENTWAFGYIGDEILLSAVWRVISPETRIPNKQPIYWKIQSFFSRLNYTYLVVFSHPSEKKYTSAHQIGSNQFPLLVSSAHVPCVFLVQKKQQIILIFWSKTKEINLWNHQIEHGQFRKSLFHHRLWEISTVKVWSHFIQEGHPGPL